MITKFWLYTVQLKSHLKLLQNRELRNSLSFALSLTIRSYLSTGLTASKAIEVHSTVAIFIPRFKNKRLSEVCLFWLFQVATRGRFPSCAPTKLRRSKFNPLSNHMCKFQSASSISCNISNASSQWLLLRLRNWVDLSLFPRLRKHSVL